MKTKSEMSYFWAACYSWKTLWGTYSGDLQYIWGFLQYKLFQTSHRRWKNDFSSSSVQPPVHKPIVQKGVRKDN